MIVKKEYLLGLRKKDNMKTKKSNLWLIVKIIVINWTLFVLIAETYFVWQSYKQVKDLSRKFETCQANFGEMEKSIESGKVILNFEKTK